MWWKGIRSREGDSSSTADITQYDELSYFLSVVHRHCASMKVIPMKMGFKGEMHNPLQLSMVKILCVLLTLILIHNNLKVTKGILTLRFIHSLINNCPETDLDKVVNVSMDMYLSGRTNFYLCGSNFASSWYRKFQGHTLINWVNQHVRYQLNQVRNWSKKSNLSKQNMIPSKAQLSLKIQQLRQENLPLKEKLRQAQTSANATPESLPQCQQSRSCSSRTTTSALESSSDPLNVPDAGTGQAKYWYRSKFEKVSRYLRKSTRSLSLRWLVSWHFVVSLMCEPWTTPYIDSWVRLYCSLC